MQIPIQDFEMQFSDDEAALSEVAQDFIRSRHSAQAARAQFGSELGHDPGTWSEMVRMGWPGVAIHTALGGSGLGFESLVPIVEAAGRRLLTTPLAGVALAANALARSAPRSLQKAWLPRLAAGTVASIALREPTGDYEAASPLATAASEGD